MKNKYVPYAVAKSIYEIDVNFYKEKNVKILLMDLDNTLDSYKLYHPTKRAVELIKKIEENLIEHIQLFLLANPVVFAAQSTHQETTFTFFKALKMREDDIGISQIILIFSWINHKSF